MVTGFGRSPLGAGARRHKGTLVFLFINIMGKDDFGKFKLLSVDITDNI
jgi:hypothetical protein